MDVAWLFGDFADEKNPLWLCSFLPQKEVIALGLGSQWWSCTTEGAWQSCCWDIICVSIGVAHIIQLQVYTYTIAEECFGEQTETFPLVFSDFQP